MGTQLTSTRLAEPDQRKTSTMPNFVINAPQFYQLLDIIQGADIPSLGVLHTDVRSTSVEIKRDAQALDDLNYSVKSEALRATRFAPKTKPTEYGEPDNPMDRVSSNNLVAVVGAITRQMAVAYEQLADLIQHIQDQSYTCPARASTPTRLGR